MSCHWYRCLSGPTRSESDTVGELTHHPHWSWSPQQGSNTSFVSIVSGLYIKLELVEKPQTFMFKWHLYTILVSCYHTSSSLELKHSTVVTPFMSRVPQECYTLSLCLRDPLIPECYALSLNPTILYMPPIINRVLICFYPYSPYP